MTDLAVPRLPAIAMPPNAAEQTMMLMLRHVQQYCADTCFEGFA